jgi:hypothetical protein
MRCELRSLLVLCLILGVADPFLFCFGDGGRSVILPILDIVVIVVIKFLASDSWQVTRLLFRFSSTALAFCSRMAMSIFCLVLILKDFSCDIIVCPSCESLSTEILDQRSYEIRRGYYGSCGCFGTLKVL